MNLPAKTRQMAQSSIISWPLPLHGPVTLEILDSRGNVVRTYASTDKPELTQEQLEKQLIPIYWVRPFRALSTDSGMHRFVWDLHYPAPDSLRHEYPIAAVPFDTPRLPQGPPAVPGEYTVRFTANGHASTTPLTVKIDPRVKYLPPIWNSNFKRKVVSHPP